MKLTETEIAVNESIEKAFQMSNVDQKPSEPVAQPESVAPKTTRTSRNKA